MDGQTLVVVLSLVLSLTAIMQFLLSRLNSDVVGLRSWAIGCALIAGGVYANGQRDSFAMIMAGNWLISAGHVAMLVGVRCFRGLPGHAVPLLLLATVMTASLLLLPEIAAQSSQRVVIHALTLGVFAAAIGFNFLHISGFATRINAWIFFLDAGFQIARSGWALLHPSTIDVVKQGSLTPMFSVLSIAVIFTVANAFTLMVSEQLRDELARKANHDPLTGLLNRRGFDLIADKLFAATQRSPRPLAALMMDLDHFKRINDGFGHAAGDGVLVAFARLVSSHLRDGDIFARMGGEEFIALLPGCDPATASAVAERIRAEVGLRAAPPRVTVSIGVATDTTGRTEVTDLIRHADAALYQAKMEGRDRIAIAPPKDEGPDRKPIEAF
jgi:diguanylate cyclase (GGDEF)-like protein